MFFENAVGFAVVLSRPASDEAALRIVRIGADPKPFEREAIAGRDMPGDVDQQNGMLRGNRVEIVSVRMTFLRKHRVVVSAAEKPVTRLQAAFGGVRAQRVLQFLDARHGASRWRLDVGEAGVEREQADMPVRVDEAGQ